MQKLQMLKFQEPIATITWMCCKFSNLRRFCSTVH